MFLFSRFEISASLTYVAPGAVCAINLVHDVGLFFGKWSAGADSDRCNRSICYGQIFPEIYFSRLYLF
jgi:hypothetical protein